MFTDYDNAIAVTCEIFWVGYYDAQARLHCNPYLLIDKDEILLIDPGSIPHFPIVMRKIMDVVNPEDITYIIASHQDPDVCGNLAVVEDVINNKNLKIVSTRIRYGSSDIWEFARSFMLQIKTVTD